MSRCQVDTQRLHKPLDEVLPLVDWLDREQTANFLGIERATLRMDQAALCYLQPKGFDYQSYQRGFSRESLEVLLEFRKLVERQGRSRAITLINQRMEDLYNARARQEGGGSSESEDQWNSYSN